MNYEKNHTKRNYTIEDLENTLDTLPNIIWLKDENGKYTYVNKAFAETMDLSKEEIIGKSDFDFGNTYTASLFSKSDKEVLKNNIPTLSENELNIKGKQKWFETFKSSLKRNDNKPTWIMASSREITLYKNLENNLENKLEEYPYSILAPENRLYPSSNYDLEFSEIVYKELINTEHYKNKDFNMLNKSINDLYIRLKAYGISLFLYNPKRHNLTLYLDVGESSINIKNEIPINDKDINILLKNNIYENLSNISENNIFKAYEKTPNISNNINYIRTYSIICSQELIGLLNIYYNNRKSPKLLQSDFIKSTCNKIGLLLKNNILSKQLKVELEKRIYSEKELELFLDTAADLFALINYDGSYIKISNNWTSTLGWNENEIFKMKFQDLIHPDDYDSSYPIRNSSQNSSKTKGSGFICRYRCKNDEYKIFEWRWSFITQRNCIILTGKDYTEENNLRNEKKRLEEAIALETLKTNFFANISHEFRTPINIILTTIQLIIMNLSFCPCIEERDKMLKYTKGIKQNSYRLLKLVNNLLDMAKISEGYYELKLINCNIVNLIEEIVLSVADHVGSKKRTIIFDTTEEEIITSCDPDKIESIMLNLLSNAVKFTDEDGKIQVNLNVDKNHKNLIVSVKDDGLKIDPVYAKIIFNRFTQIDNLLNRKNEGSGLGLALVKSIVELHGGEIWVNTDFDDGAEILFTIPIKEYENKDIKEFRSKTLNANIERFNVEFSDIYSLN